MSIFDIFSNSDAEAAAAAQTSGLNAAYSQALPQLQAGQSALTQYYGTGQNQFTNSYLAALRNLNQNYGTAATGAVNAATPQAAGALTGNYYSALQPYLQNYAGATAGTTQLGNLLGLNGAAGSASAQDTLNNLPGYQFALSQGSQNVLRNAAQTGTLASGATLNALQTQGQGQAQQNYNSYLSQLQPYLGAAQSAASGIGSTFTGLGSSLGNLYQQAGNTLGNIYTGLGSAGSNVLTGLGSGLASLSTGLGTALNTGYGNIANLGWQTQTGIGNANANQYLTELQQSGNIFGGITGALAGLGKAATGGAGSGFFPSIGSGISSLIGPSSGSYSGVGGWGGLTLSDLKAKYDIKPVGELYDGTGVYSFKYKGDSTPHVGLIAQEVEKTNPDAVVEVGGWKMVDYGKATSYAATLKRLADDNDNVVQFPKKIGGYADALNDLLKAA